MRKQSYHNCSFGISIPEDITLSSEKSSPSSTSGAGSSPAPLPPTKKDRIIKLLSMLNDADIGREVGCSREYVRQIRVQEHVENPNRYKHCLLITEEQLQYIVTHAGKETISEISRKIGLSIERVNRVCKRYSLLVSPNGKGILRRYDAAELRKIIFDSGKNLTQLSEETNIGQTTLSRYKAFFEGRKNGLAGKVINRITFSWPFKAMEVGQSVEILTNHKKKALAALATYKLQNKGKNFTTEQKDGILVCTRIQ